MEDINISTRQMINDQPEKEDQIKPISFMAMFRFANSFDYVLMAIGTICASAMGAALPAFALLWGSMTDSFGNNDSMVEAAKQVMFKFIYIGVAAVFAGWGMFGCWMITGQRQGIACRKQYLKSLLKQEIGWFDTINQSELATKFATDSFSFQGAIGQKVSTIIMTLAMFVAGFAIAFYTGWLMTLVSLCSLPVIALGGYLYAMAIANKSKDQEKQYAQAGGMTQQAIAAIKTVKQLNGQQFQADNYSETLKSVTTKAFKYGAYLGIGMGTLFLSMLFSYALGFWFGSECVEGTNSCPPSWNGGHVYSAGNVLVVFFSILMAGFNLSQLTPSIKKIAEGRSAGARIFSIIDRQPTIASSPNAIKPTQFNGVFKFDGVAFAYPKDKSRNILQKLDLVIDSKSVGFVGESGCGKSTIFQLMMRFYDPDEGRITLDGVDLRDLDLFWLRDQIGYVGQEPVLFATSIKENLLFGKEDATEQEINAALKKAEAYEFVYNLKEKLETYVGTGGGQISGGQKQRLAIARAILKNPRVLLLDEATSALDRRNQKLIQNTLNKIAEEKITITIAHRVKTIMNCSQIYVLDRGMILEHGKFNELNRYKDNTDLDQKEQAAFVKVHSKKHQELEQIIPDKPEQQQLKEQQQPKYIVPGQTQVPLTQEERQKKQQQELVKKYEEDVSGRLFSYCSDRKLLFAFGIFVCMVNGVIFPVFSIFLAKMLAILINFSNDPSGARRDANTYALIYFLLGILAFIVQLLQQTIFNIIGEEMTQKIRNQTYLKILKMPVIWFDKPRNSSGSLAARLASDCQTVNGLTTTYVAILAQNLTNLAAGIIIAFIYQWRTSLVALGLIPFMIIAGAIQMAFTTGFSAKTDSAYKDSSNLITQAMINIRTVTSFGYEDMIERKYSNRLKDPLAIGIKKGNISGILYGLSQLIMFVVFALIFYFGTVFIRDNGLSIADVFTAIYALMFAGMTAGNNSHFMPDVAAGKNSAANIFQILDGEDEDQLQIKDESKMVKMPIKGHLQLIDVDFKYETREEYVFKNMNLDIPAGWKVGFVGPSGCGKSTIHQLLQRFYEPTKGQILLDGVNLKDYDIHFLRSCLGVVSQQPVLFNETIGNNIKYNKYDATRQEIVQAANESNFNPQLVKIEQVNGPVIEIKTLQAKKKQKDTIDAQNSKRKDGQGFNKNVGVKGSHISGGQKQRVAIARVILRHPTVLLLDQATSALDSANEKIVQESLDRIMINKTAINIAHRIDTVRNSNQIMVFEKGTIIEKGTYDELMERKGYFYKLQRGLQFV